MTDGLDRAMQILSMDHRAVGHNERRCDRQSIQQLAVPLARTLQALQARIASRTAEALLAHGLEHTDGQCPTFASGAHPSN